MARRIKANGADLGPPKKGGNVASLKKLLRECANTVVEIKAERSDLNERMADIRTRLREAGAEPRAFDFAVRLREMESEAQGNYIDQLKVCFESLGIGAQGALFPAGDEKVGGASPEPA